MNIPYRTRRILSRGAMILLIVLLVALVVWLCWFTWLERYVVYTRDNGAVLDMNIDPKVPVGVEATQPEQETVSIYYNEGDNAINTSKELTQIVGYYADATALTDMDAVRSQAGLLASGTAVMLDVKDAKGNFFYSSDLSTARKDGIDPEAMDQLIKDLDKKGLYLIARLPALRDYSFGLNSTENGLFVSSGAYLWADEDYCYWLDPTQQGTITYLVNITTELKNRGFDEVVFENFCFPDTTDIRFSGDRAEALNSAAKTLVTTCSTGSFAVSFVADADGFVSPGGRSRIYMEGAAAAQADTVAQESGLEDPSIYLVFLTEVHDTRFNAYSVLRPIESAN